MYFIVELLLVYLELIFVLMLFVIGFITDLLTLICRHIAKTIILIHEARVSIKQRNNDMQD